MRASQYSNNTYEQNTQFSHYYKEETCWNNVNIYLTQQHLLLCQAAFALFDGGCVVNFTPWLLHPWETALIPSKQETGWASELVWSFCRRKNPSFLLHSNPSSSRPQPSHNRDYATLVTPFLAVCTKNCAKW